MKKSALHVFAAVVVLLALSGCNTIGGIGEDLKAAGGAISRNAKEAGNSSSNMQGTRQAGEARQK